MQVLGIVGRVALLDFVAHFQVFIVGAIHLCGVGFQDGHLVGFIQGKPLMLGHKEAVHALAHVVVAPIGTVQVYYHRIPGLMNNLGAVGVHHPGLEAVQQPGP